MSDKPTLREIALNLLYPPRCLLCGRLCGWEQPLCPDCGSSLPDAGGFGWEPDVFGCEGLLWCAPYEGEFRRGMEQFKFEGVRACCSLFGGMLAQAQWPSYDESKTVDAALEIAVQVNGKVRSVITISADADEKSIEEQALADAKIQSALQGMKVVKAIVIKKKIVNFVAKPQ